MRDHAYYNGVITPYDAAVIPLSDRSVFFGEAVYDVLIGRGKIAYQIDRHIGRLLGNAIKIGLENLPSSDEIKDEIATLLEVAEAEDFILYLQLSGKGSRRSHSRTSDEVNLLMTVTKYELPRKLSFVSAVLVPDLRHRYCNVKTTNLLPAVLSVVEAEKSGCETAIFHKNGTVTEASLANVSIIKDGVLYTHPRDTDVLPGISEDNLILHADKLGIRHCEKAFTIEQTYESDLVLVSSTTKLVRVCSEINGRKLDRCNVVLGEKIFESMQRDLFNKTYFGE